MKKIFITATILSLMSCKDSLDKQKCLENVLCKYPNSKIYKKEGSGFRFYVVDSLGMREVTTLNFLDANIDETNIMYQVK